MSWPSTEPPPDEPGRPPPPPAGSEWARPGGMPSPEPAARTPESTTETPTAQPPPAGPAYGPYELPPPHPVTPYPGPPYGPPGPGPAGRTNGLAIAALACSLAGPVTGISAPVGAVLGHLALRQIAQTGEQGASMAKAAIWVGWILTGLIVVACCAVLSLLLAAERTGWDTR